MTEDIQPEVLKKTQESLGKFIKKPVLTEKLLRKPPFRFLHDICTSAMRETGFFEGVLLGNDVKADSIKDKEAKIAFLQKVIAAVESANDIKLSIKPNKVVSGHEPVKTNEFLQALATALEKQTESNSNNKSLRKKKPQPERNQDDKIKKKNAANKTSKLGEPTTEVPSSEINKRKPTEKQSSKSVVAKKKEKEPLEKKSREKVPAVKSHDAEAESKKREKSLIKINGDVHLNEGVVGVDESSKPGEVSEPKESEPHQELTDRPQSAKIRRGSSTRITSARKPAEDGKDNDRELADSAATVFGNIINDVSSAVPAVVSSALPDVVSPTQSPPPPPSETPHVPTMAPAEQVPQSISNDDPIEKSQPAKPAQVKRDGESGIVTRPRTAIRPPTARPASARPAAPRVRDRGQLQIQEEVVKPVAGKVNVIVEQEAVAPDDEELVAVQTSVDTQGVLADDLPVTSSAPSIDGAEHGHLVSQILEAQKELEDDVFGAKKGVPGSTEIEWGVSRGADATNKEVERLRTTIQLLTRSANPLGKLLEFLQEDVDTMQQELDTWRDKNSILSAKLEQERSLTDQSIEPLKTHLEELQNSIDQEMERIAALKATILRNDEKTIRLLTGL